LTRGGMKSGKQGKEDRGIRYRTEKIFYNPDGYLGWNIVTGFTVTYAF
jgi:hypothetical protein